MFKDLLKTYELTLCGNYLCAFVSRIRGLALCFGPVTPRSKYSLKHNSKCLTTLNQSSSNKSQALQFLDKEKLK